MPSRQPFDASGFVVVTFGLTLLFAMGTVAAQRVTMTGDALGDGLLMFLIYGLVAMAAGWFEGWRKNQLGWIAARWLFVGGVSGAVATMNNWSYEIGSDRVGFAEDLLLGLPLFACLIGGAALTGSFVGRSGADRSPSP